MPRKQTRAIAEPNEIQTQSEEMNDTQAASIDEGENSPQTDTENTDSQRIHDEDGANADGSEAISQTDPESSDNSPQNAVPGSEGTENSDILQTDSEINADFEDSSPGNMSSHEKTEESKTEKTGKAENAEGGTTVSQSDKLNTDSLESTDDAARIIKKASTTIKRAGRTPVIAIDERLVAQTDEEKLRDNLIDLVESLKSNVLLCGTVQGVEQSPNNPYSLAVIYHGEFKILIPANEFMEEPDDTHDQPKETVLNYMMTRRMGAEVDYVNDLSTLEDREIYNIANGSVSRITNNSAADTHPVYGEMNGDTVLFYYSDGKIVYNKNGAENTVIENNVTTDQFTVISNKVNTAVLWTTVQDGSAELHGALYDGSVWSEDVQVSDLGKRVKFPSAVMQSDGSIFAAFNRTEKVPNEYYYDDGQADLCTIKITPSYDLELTDVYFDEENMQVYATVKNNGERNIDSYTISLNDNGVNAQKTITEPLKAGESADVEIAYNKPDDLSSRKVTLSVSLISGEEYDVDNNSAEFSIGNPDVAVSNVVINEDETKVTADVSNIGYSIANDVTVSLREGSSSGTVLEKQTVTLSANESNSVEFDINKDNIHFYKPSTQLYITAEYASDEVSLGNNDGYVIVMSKSGMANYQTEILNYSEIDNQYVVNSVAANNTDEDIKCILYSAVYSENGMLKGCGKVDADIDANCETGVDIFVSCRIEDGDIIRTFMWTENMGALANISELIATE